MSLGDIDLHFAWQAWQAWQEWQAWQAWQLGDMDLHFAWQAWAGVGRRGTYGTGLALVARA